MDKLLLKLTASLAILNGSSQSVVRPISTEVCSSVTGVLNNNGGCTFPKQSTKPETVVAVPTMTGCEIRDPLDDSIVLASDTACDNMLASIADLRRKTFLEKLKQLFQ